MKYLILLSFLALTGCAGYSGGGGYDGTATSAQGAWSTGCTSGLIITINFSGTNLSSSVSNYTDGNCTAKSLTRTSSGTAFVGGAAGSGQALDNTLQEMSAIPNSVSQVTAFNNTSECGYNNWELNKPKPIAGRNCAFMGGPQPAAGTTHYTILSVQGNNLYLGKETPGHDGTSSAQRHVELETDLVYHK